LLSKIVKQDCDRRYNASVICSRRAVRFREDGVWPPRDDLHRLRSHHRRQIRDASRRDELPRGVPLVHGMRRDAVALVLHTRSQALLPFRLREDLRGEVCAMHGEDQLLGYGDAAGVRPDLPRGVFRVLHVRPVVAAGRPLHPQAGPADLQTRLRARTLSKQSAR